MKEFHHSVVLELTYYYWIPGLYYFNIFILTVALKKEIYERTSGLIHKHKTFKGIRVESCLIESCGHYYNQFNLNLLLYLYLLKQLEISNGYIVLFWKENNCSLYITES